MPSRRIRDCCWQKLSADPTINIDRLQLPESGKPDFFHDHWAHIGEECRPNKGPNVYSFEGFGLIWLNHLVSFWFICWFTQLWLMHSISLMLSCHHAFWAQHVFSNKSKEQWIPYPQSCIPWTEKKTIIARPCQANTNICTYRWRFPEMGVPLNHPF